MAWYDSFKQNQNNNLKEQFSKEQLRENNINELKSLFIETIDDMKREGIDHLIIGLCEIPKDYLTESKSNGWINMNSTNYYSYDKLCSEEQAIIQHGKSYQRQGIVLEEVCDERKFSSAGIELIDRIRIHPFLPKMKEESNLNWVVETRFYGVQELTPVAELFVDQEYFVQDLLKDISNAKIRDYASKKKSYVSK